MVDEAAFFPPVAPKEAPESTPESAGAALDRIESGLAEVSSALSRIDDGTLLHCRSCGGPIDEALLRAEPLRRLCASCAPSPAP